MKTLSLVALFFRQCAYASAFLLVFACLAEKLAPGSVLSYVTLWHLTAITVVFQLSALLFTQPVIRIAREGQRVLLFVGGLVAICLLALMVRETELSGLVLVAAATFLLVLAIMALPMPGSIESEE